MLCWDDCNLPSVSWTGHLRLVPRDAPSNAFYHLHGMLQLPNTMGILVLRGQLVEGVPGCVVYNSIACSHFHQSIGTFMKSKFLFLTMPILIRRDVINRHLLMRLVSLCCYLGQPGNPNQNAKCSCRVKFHRSVLA